MSMRVKEIALILITRIAVVTAIAIIALVFVPNLGQFPYLDKLTASGLPSWIYSWGNFDGAHFVSIGSRGYQEFDQAFFPLYPILIHLVSYVTKDIVLAGLVVSHVSFLVGACLFYEYAKSVWGKQQGMWVFLFLIAYPTAYYFSAVYSESLFFMLTVGSLLALKKKKFVISGLCAFLAALTRIQGILLIIPLLFAAYVYWQSVNDSHRLLKKYLIVCISPIIGLGVYMAYLYYTTGDALFFLSSQSAFGANRSSTFVSFPQVYYRYIKIFLTADISYQYIVAISEFFFATLALSLGIYLSWVSFKQRKIYDFGIGLFSLAHILLPALTGTFSSMPRYSLFALSTYLVLARVQSYYLKVTFVLISILLQVLMLSQFIQGRFIT